MPIVKMPDGTQVRFPDDMPREQIRDLIASKFSDLVAQSAAPAPQQPNQSYFADLPVPGYPEPQQAQSQPQPNGRGTGPMGNAQQFLSGGNEGAASFLSLPNSLEMGARSIGPAIGNALGGDFAMPQESWLPDAGARFRAAATDVGAIKPESSDPVDQAFRRVGQEVGATVIPALGTPAKLATMLSSVGSGVGAAVAQHFAPDNPVAELAGQLAGGGGVLGVANALERAAIQKAATPTAEGLKDQAGALYETARRNGVVAPQQATQGLNQTMRGIATSEGLITPTGRVNSTYPRISEALNTFDDYSKGPMTIPQAQAVRRVLTDAAKSKEPGESRIAMMMLKEFDNFTAPLAPELAQANPLYHQAMNAGRIEQAIELAGSRAGQFSGSGFENALRTEFRAMDRQIIKGQLKGLSPEEIDAIKKVANGGPIENALRFVGKLAPTGVVSMGMGGGIPYMIGNSVGGPAVGAALGATTMGTGLAARAGATNLTANNAREAVVRALMAGKPLPVPNIAPKTASAAGALGVGQAANQNAVTNPVAMALLRAQGLN